MGGHADMSAALVVEMRSQGVRADSGSAGDRSRTGRGWRLGPVAGAKKEAGYAELGAGSRREETPMRASDITRHGAQPGEG